jgi:ATP synthase protein I
LRGWPFFVANESENAPIGEDKRVDSLEDRIAAARQAEDARQAKEHPAPAQTAGLTVISTMVGYPLGGIIIGFGLDNLFDTLPWITIVLMFVAFAGGCLHAMRLVKNRSN